MAHKDVFVGTLVTNLRTQ